MGYTNSVRLRGNFDEVVSATIDALDQEGFGVLCDIDVQETFARKLDAEFQRYRILGACNPELAHEGMTEEPELGALLPCNVVVYEMDEEVVVRAVDPEQLVGVADTPALDVIASEVHDRFARVLRTVGQKFESVEA
ncbi:DUF302 domain-containing protein [Halomarina oriensis]|uniref:DUF302 domain-containing protein n=1 Tax=Halomarina oriensis TaxID=671145 RepID=A0A6B0GK40_9EURY|nr:DUF302 domain-containing protein [Halomarina oriensis]MWG33769.1 DUF302 domain-containing protein [Halomarina oriensis]